MDHRKTADLINPMDYKESFSKRVPRDPTALTPKSERLFKASVIVVCGWAALEAPLELGDLIDSTWLLALVASKLLMGLIGTLAIANLPFARQVFTFFCGASVLAVAPALPLEYTHSIAIALFSTIECVGKAACVASFAIAPLAGDSFSADLSIGKRTASNALITQYNQAVLNAVRDVALAGSRLQDLDEEPGLQAQKIDVVSFAQPNAHARYESVVASRQKAMVTRQAVLPERISMQEVDGQHLSQDIAMSKALGGGYREETPVALRVQ